MKFRLPPRAPSLDAAMLEFFRRLGIPEHEWQDPGLDLAKTPARIAKMLRDEVLSSYKPGSKDELIRRFTCFDSYGHDPMVLSGPIAFSSTCAHHLLPFTGQAFVAYIPDRKLVGASKLPRVVEYFSKMLQLQERLCDQTAEFIHEHAEAKITIVMMDAAHLCMRCRGIKQQETRMMTVAIRPRAGGDHDDETRPVLDEFYKQVALLKG